MNGKVKRRIISAARTENETADQLVVVSGAFARLGCIVIVGLLLLGGVCSAVVWWQASKNVTLAFGMGSIPLLPALALTLVAPFSVKLTIDARKKVMTLTRAFLLGVGPWSRHREQTVNFAEINRVEQRTALQGMTNNVELATDDGLRLTLQFGSRRTEAARVADKIVELLGEEAAPAIRSPEATKAVSVAESYSKMLRTVRSWGIWLLVLGALHLVSLGFLSAPWGILLIVVGLASFYFRTPVIFVLYAVTLAWAALSNILSGQTGWIVFAIFQFYLAMRVFQQFLHFRQTEAEHIELDTEGVSGSALASERAARVFPWTGCLLGSLSLTGLVAVFVAAVILVESSGSTTVPSFLGLMEGLVVNLGILGFAVGLASLLSGYRRKLVAILGMIAGVLTLLTEIVLGLL